MRDEEAVEGAVADDEIDTILRDSLVEDDAPAEYTPEGLGQRSPPQRGDGILGSDEKGAGQDLHGSPVGRDRRPAHRFISGRAIDPGIDQLAIPGQDQRRDAEDE